MPSNLNVTIIQNAGGTITTSTITVPLPAIFNSSSVPTLDSGQQASQQTGFSALDIMSRNIFRAGGFTDLLGNFYPREVIQKITVS